MNSSTSHPDSDSRVAPMRSRRFGLVAAIVLAAIASTASAQQQARQPAGAGRARGAGEGLQSARARNLRVPQGRAERPGPRRGNLLLQMLDVPQRVGAGRRAQARRPVQAPDAGHRRSASTTRPSRPDPQRQRQHAGLQARPQRGRPRRPDELAARREVLLEFRRAAAQPALQGRERAGPRQALWGADRRAEGRSSRTPAASRSKASWCS